MQKMKSNGYSISWIQRVCISSIALKICPGARTARPIGVAMYPAVRRAPRFPGTRSGRSAVARAVRSLHDRPSGRVRRQAAARTSCRRLRRAASLQPIYPETTLVRRERDASSLEATSCTRTVRRRSNARARAPITIAPGPESTRRDTERRIGPIGPTAAPHPHLESPQFMHVWQPSRSTTALWLHFEHSVAVAIQATSPPLGPP